MRTDRSLLGLLDWVIFTPAVIKMFIQYSLKWAVSSPLEETAEDSKEWTKNLWICFDALRNGIDCILLSSGRSSLHTLHSVTPIGPIVLPFGHPWVFSMTWSRGLRKKSSDSRTVSCVCVAGVLSALAWRRRSQCAWSMYSVSRHPATAGSSVLVRRPEHCCDRFWLVSESC